MGFACTARRCVGTVARAGPGRASTLPASKSIWPFGTPDRCAAEKCNASGWTGGAGCLAQGVALGAYSREYMDQIHIYGSNADKKNLNTFQPSRDLAGGARGAIPLAPAVCQPVPGTLLR